MLTAVHGVYESIKLYKDYRRVIKLLQHRCIGVDE